MCVLERCVFLLSYNFKNLFFLSSWFCLGFTSCDYLVHGCMMLVNFIIVKCRTAHTMDLTTDLNCTTVSALYMGCNHAVHMLFVTCTYFFCMLFACCLHAV